MIDLAGHMLPRLEALQRYIAQTYFGLRLVLAILAFAFPWLLYVGAKNAGYGWESSLSAFYEAHNGLMRDQFVGVLWAVGMILLAYRGLRLSESIALVVAGVSAVGIASFPCHCASPTDAPAKVHIFFAFVFFGSIGYICIWRARDTLTLLPAGARPPERTFKWLYRVLGILMVALPIAAAAPEHWAHGSKTVLLAEIAAIYVFGVFWCVKSWELGKSDGERDIARGRVVRVRGGGLARLHPQAVARPSGSVYPAKVRPGELGAAGIANPDAPTHR